MMRLRRVSRIRVAGYLLLIVVTLVAAACGGGSGGSAPAAGSDGNEQESASAQSGRVVPTMPAAQFAAPTTMIDATKIAESATTPEAEEVDVEFGGQVYARLCADCHGEGLAGVSGKAQPIADYALDAGGLTDLLRTGGGYGNEHIFGLDKVSPEGIESLQAYLETLSE